VQQQGQNTPGQMADLLTAVKAYDFMTVKALLTLGVDKEVKNDAGETALHLAAKLDFVPMVQELLEARL
jgi:ankyrin repeat protein